MWHFSKGQRLPKPHGGGSRACASLFWGERDTEQHKDVLITRLRASCTRRKRKKDSLHQETSYRSVERGRKRAARGRRRSAQSRAGVAGLRDNYIRLLPLSCRSRAFRGNRRTNARNSKSRGRSTLRRASKGALIVGRSRGTNGSRGQVQRHVCLVLNEIRINMEWCCAGKHHPRFRKGWE